MAVRLAPYPEYRDSGLPWLGRIPSHWDIRRNGRLFAQINQTGFADLPILEVSLRTGVRVRRLDGAGRKQMMSDRDKYKRSAAGDLTYNMMRMWQGAVGVAPIDGLVSPAYVVARPFEETISDYYSYLFRTNYYMDEVDKYSRGIVKDRNRLYWADFKRMPSTYPPKHEQKIIADFLDAYGNYVNRLIRAKRRLIELLDEQKQAIIHRAVTRGLDPGVRLKASGIEWLGDVPDHWDIAPLRRYTIGRCDGPFGSGLKSSHYRSSGVRVVRLQNIGHSEFRSDNAVYISPEHYATLGEHGVIANDLLIAGLGDEQNPAGRACVAPFDIEPAMVKADCFRFRIDSTRLIPKFIAYQLSATANHASAILSTGATRQRVNLQASSARAIAVPTPYEQVKIVDHINGDIQPIEKCVSKVCREIDLLNEYRTRQITDIVTGKLDVRDVNLPELVGCEVRANQEVDSRADTREIAHDA